MIAFKSVSLKHGERTILDDLTFAIAPGESLCIVGPQRSGKTAVLSILLAEERPTLGTVMIDNVDLFSLPNKLLTVYRQSLGIMLPHPLLLPDRSVAEHIAFVMRAQRKDEEKIKMRTEEVLSDVGLSEKAHFLSGKLTAGAKQRLALACAIANDPKILLAGDPFRSLDDSEVEELLALLKAVSTAGATVILTTRDEEIARRTGFHVIALENGKMVEEVNEKHEKAEHHQTVTVGEE